MLSLVVLANLSHVQANSQKSVPAIQNKTSDVDLLANKLAVLNSYQAKFEQEITSDVGEQVEASKGVFSIQRPNHFRWEKGEEQLIVADGSHVFTHDIDLEQVTIQNQSQLLKDSPALLLTSDAETISQSFNVKKFDNDKSTIFELKPKTEEGAFDYIRLSFNDNQITGMLILDSFGQQTKMLFSDIKFNSKLNVNLFQFTIPKDVDVIDSRNKLN
jgi:outer membrane lipoprotein carrier protein